MSVDFNKMDPEVRKLMRKGTGTIKRAAEFFKKNKEPIFTGLELQAMQMRIETLLRSDDDYMKERKALNERYSKELEAIQTRYVESYIKAGLL